jgi:hypothetical protein
MAKPIEIRGQVFPTKKAAEDAIRAIRDSVPIGKPIPPAALSFMLDVLERHPDAEQKIGVGVASMYVGVDREHGTKCFFLTRTDGTETDFSFKHCLTPRSPLQDLKSALRAEVAGQVINFRDNAFAEAADGRITCPITQARITTKESHIDHEPPQTFDIIAKDFIAAQKIDPQKVEILGYEDGATVKRLADRQLAGLWLIYHGLRARLRVVSIRANLSDIRRGA